MKNEPVTLETLAGGAAGERFEAELEKVLRNMSDINTDPKAVREITLKVSFLPNDARELAAVLIASSSKLAGLKPVPTTVYFGQRNGVWVAQEHNPKQAGLFDQKPADKVDAMAAEAAGKAGR